MRELDRRSFFNLFRLQASSNEPARELRDSEAQEAEPIPRTFDLGGFYRQREILGLVGSKPPPIDHPAPSSENVKRDTKHDNGDSDE